MPCPCCAAAALLPRSSLRPAGARSSRQPAAAAPSAQVSGKLSYVLLPPEASEVGWRPSFAELQPGQQAAAAGAVQQQQADTAAASSSGSQQQQAAPAATAAPAAASSAAAAAAAEEAEEEEQEGDDDAAAASGSAAAGFAAAAAAAAGTTGGDAVYLDPADLDLLESLNMAGGKAQPKRPEHKFHKKAVRSKGNRGQAQDGGGYDGAQLAYGKKGGVVRVAGY
jgi:hypothetical protein